MAAKKKSAKKLGKKDMKKTKGGILIGLNQPGLRVDRLVDDTKVSPGLTNQDWTQK